MFSKKSLSNFFVLMSIYVLFSSITHASLYQIKKVKTVGVMNTKVIYQSSKLFTNKSTNALSGIMVLKWGTQVFEIVKGNYICDQNKQCRYTSHKRLSSYEKCEVYSKIDSVYCWAKIEQSTGNIDPDLVVDDRPDAIDDTYYRNAETGIHYDDNYPEFPARIRGEFDDIPF